MECLPPAWGWHSDPSPTAESDLNRLIFCLELSTQDAIIAHRGIAVVGELFVSAMVAIGIDYDPNHQQILMKYPETTAKDRPNAEETPKIEELIEQTGITAEVLIQDMRRLKCALQLYDKVQQVDVEKYFAFIDIVCDFFEKDRDPRNWETCWTAVEQLTNHYRAELIQDAKTRLHDHKLWEKERVLTIKIRKAFGVHTAANNSAIGLGLIYGDGDMFQTTQRATECGLDTDCNAGNAAAILGSYLGQTLISPYMKRFIRGEILSPLTNWKGITIQGLAEQCNNQMNRLNQI